MVLANEEIDKIIIAIEKAATTKEKREIVEALISMIELLLLTKIMRNKNE
jgi:hypothetical protein